MAESAFLEELMEKNPFLRKLHQKQEQEQKLAEMALPGNCHVLGITYTPDLRDSAMAIAMAAAMKPDCDRCQYDVMTCSECKGLSVLYDEYKQPRNAFLRCEKYEKYLKMSAVNAKTEKLLGGSGLGKRFMQRRFETFKVTAETKAAYDACVAFCEDFSEDSKGLRLVGNYGCGKTHLTAAIIHRLAEKGIGGVFVVVPELLRAIRRGFNQPNEDSEKIVKLTEKAPLLVLDDLGAEKPSDWVREQLYVIINRRYENMLPTVITTNCTMKELVDRVGQRTASRIIEMTTPYKITAADYRLKM